MTVLRWEAPPSTRPRGNWQRTSELLQQRPGVWALIVENEEPDYAYRVSATLKTYGCQVITRMANKRVSLWARAAT